MAQSVLGNTDLFKQSFREEAREILVELEAALLELNGNPGDQELVGRVFRGLHTIKGSGAMFGFEQLAAFTHNLETAFDEVRNGRLAITAELIDLTLSALDQIRSMLEEGAAGAPSADPARCEQILVQVRQLAGQPATSPVAPRAVEKTPAGAASSGAFAGPLREWHIHFAPGPSMLLNGTNPLLLLRELRELGGLSVKASMASVPPLRELDPERCYVTWEMVLATAAGKDALRDVFIFVEDGCELTLAPAAEPAVPSIADLTAAALTSRAPPPPAAAPPTGPTTPPACAFPRPSWTSLSTWWASWSPCRPGSASLPAAATISRLPKSLKRLSG